ncbi:hypothetical protein OIU79_010763 [Salix purpurea]|uniref:Uncharacterized protein n=1 Tax=Salix purpurea TaxID=77065 RepID=A0A9Q0QH17_SALPP|nr:hypothetical protein OIU79_010763 [Salix purpurea]
MSKVKCLVLLPWKWKWPSQVKSPPFPAPENIDDGPRARIAHPAPHLSWTLDIYVILAP